MRVWPGRADLTRITRFHRRGRQEVLQPKGFSESRYAPFPASEGNGLLCAGNALLLGPMSWRGYQIHCRLSTDLDPIAPEKCPSRGGSERVNKRDMHCNRFGLSRAGSFPREVEIGLDYPHGFFN